MKNKFIFTLFILCTLTCQSVYAATAYYHPTPYPLYKYDESAMPQDLDIVHVWDGWLSSIYNPDFVRDDRLQVGGWGDQYRTYINFDVKGLPDNPSNAILWLKTYDRGDESSTTPLAVCKVGSSWDTELAWNSQPSMITCAGWFTLPTPGDWWGINYTSWYNEWKAGTVANNGIMMYPQYTNNNFNVFRSSRYSTSSFVMLQFDFTPTLELKMPLPGGHQWLLTNEIGGYECKGVSPWPDTYHQDSTGNYFSIDFSWRNIADSGAAVYDESTDNIPILAAAGGKVFVGYNEGNGHYVVVDHDSDGNHNTGFQTRYLHFKTTPSVSNGSTVDQGDLLGYMGDTGIGTGVHLHFGIRYQNSGLSSVSGLTKVIMEGKLLKSYQTRCSEDQEGVPLDWEKYYRSYNTSY